MNISDKIIDQIERVYGCAVVDEVPSDKLFYILENNIYKDSKEIRCNFPMALRELDWCFPEEIGVSERKRYIGDAMRKVAMSIVVG